MGKSFAVLQKLCGGQGGDYPLLNMLVGYSNDSFHKCDSENGATASIECTSPKFCENMSPQFFTGRSLRPAGIGIEAPVQLCVYPSWRYTAILRFHWRWAMEQAISTLKLYVSMLHYISNTDRNVKILVIFKQSLYLTPTMNELLWYNTCSVLRWFTFVNQVATYLSTHLRLGNPALKVETTM